MFVNRRNNNNNTTNATTTDESLSYDCGNYCEPTFKTELRGTISTRRRSNLQLTTVKVCVESWRVEVDGRRPTASTNKAGKNLFQSTVDFGHVGSRSRMRPKAVPKCHGTGSMPQKIIMSCVSATKILRSVFDVLSHSLWHTQGISAPLCLHIQSTSLTKSENLTHYFLTDNTSLHHIIA